MNRLSSARPLATGLLLTAGLLGGCHGPGGGLLGYTGATQTYESSEARPKSVNVVDTRTNEVVFEMDIPVGKQLTLDFITDAGPDPVHRPDLMRWAMFDKDTRYGRLTAAIPVPNDSTRRVDVFLREPWELAPAPPERPLRREDVLNLPPYWQPEGGPLPNDDKGIYD